MKMTRGKEAPPAGADASSVAEQVKEKNSKPFAEREHAPVNLDMLVPSGSTMLNLACSDSPHGAFQLGGIVTTPGSSQSGKSFTVWTMFGEVCALERFDKYNLYYDDVEQRLAFDISYLFGDRAKERVKPPPHSNSASIQDFERNTLTLYKEKEKFIYVLDSFDALTSNEELEKELKKALAMAKSDKAAEQIAGSYGTEKAKIAGQILRMVNDRLKETKSLIVIVQQRRQRMNAPKFASPWTTSGGEAPFFYSNHQVWYDKTSDIKRNNRKIGSEISAKMKKNSITGKLRDVTFNIYYDYGIDDIGSVIDFMVEEKKWKKNSGSHVIDAEDLGLTLVRGDLIRAVEENGLEMRLKNAAGRAWKEIEDSLKLGRKPRYC